MEEDTNLLETKLLEKLLVFDPKDRLTVEEVVFCCCLILKLFCV
jgi:hypothetical protein